MSMTHALISAAMTPAMRLRNRRRALVSQD
jgi:hypothetical protein